MSYKQHNIITICTEQCQSLMGSATRASDWDQLSSCATLTPAGDSSQRKTRL